MRPMAPFAISAVLACLALLSGFAVIRIIRSSDSTALDQTQQSATGNFLSCPDGHQVEASYARAGDDFVVVGTLASHGPDSLLVRGPLSYVRMTLANSARIQGPYVSGDIVRVSGKLAQDGAAQATDYRPVCSGDVVAAVTPAPAVTVQPSQPPPPVVHEDVATPAPTQAQPQTAEAVPTPVLDGEQPQSAAPQEKAQPVARSDKHDSRGGRHKH